TTQLLAREGGRLDGTEIDRKKKWETRHAWRRLIHQLSQLTSTSERWRQSLAEVSKLDLHRLIPDLPKSAAELDHRFADSERMLYRTLPVPGVASVRWNLEDRRCPSLTQLEQAALTLHRRHLHETV